MIAVDWGTSNFRAFRISAEGAVVGRCSSPQGILRVGKGNFETALRAEVGAWLQEGENHILLCGMVGSRQGWIEAEYLRCPVGIEELAASLLQVPFFGAEVLLVPGVMGPAAATVPELMRGEETAAMGILDAGAGAGLVCLPGTHSKWIELSDRRIVSFTTSMTGDVYSALCKCTILERTMTSEAATDEAAFREGVMRSADSGGLLHHLFGVRTRVLMGQIREEASASYLSGLLIGHEVRATMPHAARVVLAGAAQLCGLYAQAIEACGGEAVPAEEDAAALGLGAIGRRLGWT
ncbi:MAG TPA: 2-dehydro-3-deoxygalactonokinase [Acidobacteriaceae bacterium]|nr:2-dehydro-3-deoxygalactonokinase [Acidobacteriaceae bacterium]